MKSIGIGEFNSQSEQHLGETLRAAFVITAGDRPTAAIVPVSSDEDVEELMLTVSPRLREIVEDAAKRIQAGGGIAHDEFWRRVESASGGQDFSNPST